MIDPIPMFELSDFEYDRASRVLYGNCKDLGLRPTVDRFPLVMKIRSHHTQQIIVFRQVSAEIQMENEFWDGEMMEYVPAEKCNVKMLVLSLGF